MYGMNPDTRPCIPISCELKEPLCHARYTPVGRAKLHLESHRQAFLWGEVTRNIVVTRSGKTAGRNKKPGEVFAGPLVFREYKNLGRPQHALHIP
jgi:hypothetical protein